MSDDLVESGQDENDNLPEVAGASWFASLANFDWLHIPGAVRAIARLVTGSAEVGGAWLDVAKAKGEQKARAVRDVTAARSETTRALTKIVAKTASKNSELLARAEHYLVAEQLQKQENREAVAREATTLLLEGSSQSRTDEPDVDWLNVFASFAEKATSERMRKHWASVLAGEIRKPGSFSLTTLQLLSVVDAEIAQIISESARWICDNHFIPCVGKLQRGDGYLKLMKLEAVGFLQLGSTQYFVPGAPVVLTMVDTQISFATQNEIGTYAALISPAGRQVLSLVESHSADKELLDAFVVWLQTAGCTAITVRKR